MIQLRGHAADIADPSRRAMVERLFARYEAQVLPRLPYLRASVLHQDANDWNVITDSADPSAIAGLIDFGDMCYGRTVNELAITLAYALLAAPDLYAATRALVSAFAGAFPCPRKKPNSSTTLPACGWSAPSASRRTNRSCTRKTAIF